MDPTISYQRKLAAEYLDTIGCSATYLHGNPVLPVVPVQTKTGSVMIIGAYPTAKFATIGRERDVPVGDIDAPFSNQTYFDGASVRTVKAGQELAEKYLTQLGLAEADLWLTNLVKVFLFKEGHVEKYKRLVSPALESRSRFEEFAKASIPLLTEEILLANPKAVILLGEEVTKLLVDGKGPGQKFFDGKPHALKDMDPAITAFCLPHPGIVMRPARKQIVDAPPPVDWSKRLETLLPSVRSWLVEQKVLIP
ncbi:MAG: uracil-DNA glycosylase family protein [Bacteroidota bacterium]